MNESHGDKTYETVCIKFVFSHTECCYEVSLDPNSPASQLADCKAIADTTQKFLDDLKIPQDEGFRIFPSPDLEDDSLITAYEWAEMSGAIIVCPENPQMFSELLKNAPANNIALDLLLSTTGTPQKHKDARPSFESAPICSGCVDLGMKVDRLIKEQARLTKELARQAKEQAKELHNLAKELRELKNIFKGMQTFVESLLKIYRRQVLVQARLKISQLLDRQPDQEEGIFKWRDFLKGISAKELEGIGLTTAAVSLLVGAIKDGDDLAHHTPVSILATAFTSLQESEIGTWSELFLIGTGVTLDDAVSDDQWEEADKMMESMSTLEV
jgi:hypothetical protein